MAIFKEVWQSYIAEKIYQKNDFLKKAFDASGNVIDGRIVHIPQAGNVGEPILNPSSFPLTVSEREDSDIVYPLESLAMPPIRIANIEKYELSYDKMNSVLSEQVSKLTDRLGTIMLYNWARGYTYSGSLDTDEVTKILTTGANAAAHMPSSSGVRKKFTRSDLRKASTVLDKQGVTKDDRVAIMSPTMYEQLTDDSTLTNYRLSEYNIETGFIAKLEGFEIHVRPTVLGYKNEADLLNLFNYTPDVSDCDAVLCFQKNYVEFAEGGIDFFEDIRNPQYLGSIYAAEVRFGGRKRYANSTGIISIVQDIP